MLVQNEVYEGLLSKRKLKPAKVAIIHYWLVNYRGGEKVVEALCEMFPNADIYTNVYNKDRIPDSINKHNIKTTFIQSLPFAKKHYQKYLPLMPLALEHLDLSDYDLVISSESGPAKGVIVRPDAVHIAYVHSPMRYIWDQYHVYRNNAGFFKKMLLFSIASGLRQWDVTSSSRVDYCIANSKTVSNRIEKYWRRKAEVISPPVDTHRFDFTKERDDFYLYVGEFVHYKRADLAVKACTDLGRKLVVVGGGEELKNLKKIAGPTVEFVGKVPDHILTEYYERCKALIFPAEEDFGIVPVEAMAAGAPVICFGRGGASETVLDGETGIFFEEQTTESLTNALQKFESNSTHFNPRTIAMRALDYRKSVFKNSFQKIVEHLIAGKYEYPQDFPTD